MHPLHSTVKTESCFSVTITPVVKAPCLINKVKKHHWLAVSILMQCSKEWLVGRVGTWYYIAECQQTEKKTRKNYEDTDKRNRRENKHPACSFCLRLLCFVFFLQFSFSFAGIPLRDANEACYHFIILIFVYMQV